MSYRDFFETLRKKKKFVVSAMASFAVALCCVAVGAGCDKEHVHEWSTPIIVKEATCTASGVMEKVCLDEDCGEKQTLPIEATGHKGGKATCVQKARCSVCKEFYGSLSSTHVGGKATCEEKAVCTLCKKEYGNFAAHTIAVEVAIKPTCTSAGRTEKRYCSVCDEVFAESEILPATGHDLTWDETKQLDVCSVCDVKSSNDFLYDLQMSADGTYWVLTEVGNCRDSALVIPSQYQGKPIKEIANNAFQNYKELVSLVVATPDIKIASGAFQNCINLQSVEIGGKEGNASIGAYAFAGCTSLERVFIKDSVKEIGSSAFNGCVKLSDVSLSENITTIGNNAFQGCKELKVAVLPSALKTLGNGVYANCTKLEKVVFNAQLTTMGDSVFANCSVLSASTLTVEALEETKNTFVLPESLTSIGDGVFENCKALTSLDLGDGLKTIGKNAFVGCTALKYVYFGDGLKEVGADAFAGLEAVEEVHVSNVAKWCDIQFGNGNANPFSVGAGLYIADALTTNVKIPKEVTKVYSYAFYQYDKMTSLEIGLGVESIGVKAFADCYKLATVKYSPIQCADVAVNTFAGAGKDTAGLTLTVDRYAMNVPANLFYTVAEGTIDNTPNLTIVKWESDDYCKTVGANAFANATALKQVTFGIRLIRINEKAFQNCTALESVVVPGDRVTTVGARAFEDCAAIKTVSAPMVVFAEMPKTSVTTLTLTGGTLTANVMGDGANLTTLTIENKVTEIPDRAFDGNKNLKTVVIKDGVSGDETKQGVQSIGDFAFENCEKLSSLRLSKQLKVIGFKAFQNCIALTSLTLPEAVEIIEERAFYNCGKLATLTVNAKLQKIEKEAFKGTILKTVDFINRVGWKVTTTGGVEIALDSSDLANKATAAYYLSDYQPNTTGTEKYASFEWTCTVSE